jgi:hypothetical protein
MRVIRIAAMAAVAASLSGCWAVFIPGSVTGAVSDSITGAEGEHCVGESQRIGDKIRLNDGRVGTVVSTSGTSVRCRDSRYPIRAKLSI